VIVKWIEIVIGLLKELNPLVCLLLFVLYLIFDMAYVRYISYMRDYRRWAVSNMSVFLFFISLYGYSEVLKDNVMYILPVAAGMWLGSFIQMTIEKKNNESET
jgi:uncharacterized protein YebE (UPF0316 family)